MPSRGGLAYYLRSKFKQRFDPYVVAPGGYFVCPENVGLFAVDRKRLERIAKKAKRNGGGPRRDRARVVALRRAIREASGGAR
jgi:hypothetical protein